MMRSFRVAEMVSNGTLSNAAQAASYYDAHLAPGDYYDDKNRAPSSWFGSGAESLGLSGRVDKDVFGGLCVNRRPDGSKLTIRDDEKRRVAYDFCVSPPKSVSIAALVDGDLRVREAHRAAVSAAQAELERFAAVRIRKGEGDGKDRITGNVIGAAFEHESSRAVSKTATPDPQLHTHLVIFNASQDQDGSFKALQNFEMLRAKALVNAVYEHKLCQELVKAGYHIESTGEVAWEIAEVSKAEIAHFSKRHESIQNTIDKCENVSNRGALAAKIAQDNRIAKQQETTAKALLESWQEQRAAIAKESPSSSIHKTIGTSLEISASEAVEFAKEKLFERAAVVKDVAVELEAFRRARGSSASIEEIKAAVRADKNLLRSEDGRQVTTAAVLGNESRIVELVQAGKESFAPLAIAGLVGDRAEKLNEGQKKAAEILVHSRDAVTVFRGGAGVGKSFTLAALKQSIEAGGGAVATIAPQNKQVFGLKNDGFFEAQTLASFLQKSTKNPPAPSTVLLVDESGQIGGEDMRQLLVVAKRAGLRVVLAGDSRQLGAVAASDALIAIERYGKALTAELPADETTIQRQQKTWYKRAAALADKQKTGEALDVLDAHGCVRECANPVEAAADSFMKISRARDAKTGKHFSPLVYSETNKTVDLLNSEIRERLKERGKITAERKILGLRGLDAAKADLQLAGTYATGAVLVAHKKSDQFAGGEMLRFIGEARGGIYAARENGEKIRVSSRNLIKFCSLCREENITVGTGDKIRLRANVRLDKNDKLANGQICEVRAIGENGQLTVSANGREIQLPADFRKFSHGYASTIYGVQGESDEVPIWANDAAAGAATNAKSGLVGMTRGKRNMRVFTADKETLRTQLGATGERGLALDIVPQRKKDFVGLDGSRIQRAHEPTNPPARLPDLQAKKTTPEINQEGKHMTQEEWAAVAVDRNWAAAAADRKDRKWEAAVADRMWSAAIAGRNMTEEKWASVVVDRNLTIYEWSAAVENRNMTVEEWSAAVAGRNMTVEEWAAAAEAEYDRYSNAEEDRQLRTAMENLKDWGYSDEQIAGIDPQEACSVAATRLYDGESPEDMEYYPALRQVGRCAKAFGLPKNTPGFITNSPDTFGEVWENMKAEALEARAHDAREREKKAEAKATLKDWGYSPAQIEAFNINKVVEQLKQTEGKPAVDRLDEFMTSQPRFERPANYDQTEFSKPSPPQQSRPLAAALEERIARAPAVGKTNPTDPKAPARVSYPNLTARAKAEENRAAKAEKSASPTDEGSKITDAKQAEEKARHERPASEQSNSVNEEAERQQNSQEWQEWLADERANEFGSHPDGSSEKLGEEAKASSAEKNSTKENKMEEARKAEEKARRERHEERARPPQSAREASKPDPEKQNFTIPDVPEETRNSAGFKAVMQRSSGDESLQKVVKQQEAQAKADSIFKHGQQSGFLSPDQQAEMLMYRRHAVGRDLDREFSSFQKESAQIAAEEKGKSK